ncbi:DUF2811 domain-containing protein [Crocosphaera chwakensis]|uniref:Uncharacterized protein n=1 Tax=Crocosphaera chwakensis CCY0110 TaxID=391612 RepID=A3IYN6_9CHRO|nr:DUF2811 domain-containing protein [Crocosphaera chwakensis]EAZ88422.1 hypothetical protein CY0110_06469 [Crocosphaera chwakensis CCY0110]
MKTSIAFEVEIPEETYILLTNFIENHAPLGFNEVVSLAVSTFLTDQKIPFNSCQSYSSNVYEYPHHSKVLEQ